MFSVSPIDFVKKNILDIFNIISKENYLNKEFISENLHMLLIQKILNSEHEEEVKDVNVLVGLLFN